MKKISILLTFLVICFLVVSCNKVEDIKETYTINFDSMGGSEVKSQILTEGEVSKEPNDPILENYNFIGWFLNLEDTKSFTFGFEITKDIILYAKWEEVISSYTITFDSDGGSPINKLIVDGKTIPTQPASPTKTGYKFMGWMLNNEPYDFSKVLTSNIVLVAKWELDFNQNDYQEVISRLDTFNQSLLNDDYEISVSLKRNDHLVEVKYQMRNEGLSLVTIVSPYSSNGYYGLIKTDDYSYDILSSYYDYTNGVSNLTSFEHALSHVELKGSNEIQALIRNFSFTKDQDSYKASLTWRDFSSEALDLINNYFASSFDLRDINKINFNTEVNVVISITDYIEFKINFDIFEYHAKYEKINNDFEIETEDLFQRGEHQKDHALLPITEGLKVNETTYVNTLEPYYYLVDLKKGYYDFSFYNHKYTFESLDGTELNFDVEVMYHDDYYRKLIFVESDQVFYAKVEVAPSMHEKRIIIEFTSYQYNPKEEIRMTDYLDLKNQTGGYYDPIIIDLNFDYDVYEVIGGDFDIYNLAAHSVSHLNGDRFTYLYKKDNTNSNKILIRDANIDLMIKGINIVSEIETSKDNPYTLTTETSPNFMIAPGYNELYLELVVEEAAVYQIITGSDKGQIGVFVNGDYIYEEGISKLMRLNKGTYKLSVSSNYLTYFNIKVNVYQDQEINVELGQTYETTVYENTNLTYLFSFNEDTAFEINLEHDDEYTSEIRIVLPDGKMYFYDEMITALYIKTGTYKIIIPFVYQNLEVSMYTKKIDTPNHTNYSFEFINIAFDKQIDLVNSVSGYYIYAETIETANYYIIGNIELYMIEQSGYSKTSISTTYNRYMYQSKYFYIPANQSGYLKFNLQIYN